MITLVYCFIEIKLIRNQNIAQNVFTLSLKKYINELHAINANFLKEIFKEKTRVLDTWFLMPRNQTSRSKFGTGCTDKQSLKT
ncbi:hypothetical protein BTO13_08115 [Polaribacter gangjinensis]|uniref:Uncharacterized protein n=1 Tax=Polaribacter gangjinensis TaxID=574710 RepID=A0A2S7WD64_9FLAO|nr:hypothetical protein BTO13_08115 [Polaribacter gangjinensis]